MSRQPVYRTSQPYTEQNWGETPAGAPVEVTTIWRSFYDEERVTSGVNTLNFTSYLRSKRRLPVNPYTMTHSRRSTTDFMIANYHNVDGHTLGGTASKAIPLFPASTAFYCFDAARATTQSNNRAVTKLNEKLAAVKFNAAQFFAERKQTANLIADTARRIAQAASALRRADLKGLSRALSLQGGTSASAFARVQKTHISKRIATHWLEYQYGWKPLVLDIYDAAELLAQHVEFPTKPHGVVRARAVVTDSFEQRSPRAGYPHLMVDLDASATFETQLKAEFTLEDGAREVLSQTGITNPALLAWELLPYSFVVDWFIPVGTYLENLTAQDGFSLSGACTTNFSRAKTTMNLGYYEGSEGLRPTWYFTKFQSGSVIQQDTKLQRLNTLPVYVPLLRSPLGGKPMQRLATALSLLRALFK